VDKNCNNPNQKYFTSEVYTDLWLWHWPQS